jgi:hypothetical protein
MEGFQKSFGQYLALFPYDSHIDEEKYYHSLFISIMLHVNFAFAHQKHTSHGILDSQFRTKKGDDFILEFKHLKERKTSKGNYPTPPIENKKIADLRKRMAPKAQEALDQITEKYAKSHETGQGRLIKVGIVIARRTFVLAQYEIVEREPSSPSPKTSGEKPQ